VRESDAVQPRPFQTAPRRLFRRRAPTAASWTQPIAVERYGYSREELLASMLSDIAARDLGAATSERVRQALEQLTSFEWRAPAERRATNSTWKSGSQVQPFRTAGPHGSVRDITSASGRRKNSAEPTAFLRKPRARQPAGVEAKRPTSPRASSWQHEATKSARP